MTAHIRKSVQEMQGYVPGEQPRDKGIIKLNTNENPYPPSARVCDILGECDADMLRRYPDPVCSDLRREIAAQHGCDPSQVFVCNGSDEVLALCTRAFVENDGSVGYFRLSYSLYPVLADIRDVSRKPVELADGFQWRTPDAADCSLFLLTNPNAPTGILYPKDEVRAFCQGFDGVVVLDEAYVDFAREDCMDLALAHENVLVARTLSKSSSLAGLRLGYAVGDQRLIEALMKIKDSYNVNALSQRVALAAIRDREHTLGNVARIKTTRKRLAQALQSIGYTVFPSETNFLWVQPGDMAAADVFEGLKKKRILVRFFAGEDTGRFLRITVGTDEEIDQLLAAIRGLEGS